MTPSRARRLLTTLLVLPLVAVGTVAVAAPADAAGLYLHRGSRGAAVKTLETRLVKVAALPRRAVDRRYRTTTVRAVKRFQRARHLRVTGTVTQRTWDLVARAYKLAIAPPPSWQRPGWAAPTVTAHRGGAREAPENTLFGIQRAVELGVDTVEFDVRSTADHQLVLLHDRTLDRTTDCTGEVFAKTLLEVQSECRVDGGYQVPTFEDVARYLQDKQVKLSPEVKDFGYDFDDEELAGFVGILRAHGLLGRTLAQSFYPGLFAKLRDLQTPDEPAMTLVYLSGTVVYAQAVRDAEADVASINLAALTRANVDTYHTFGIPVFAWTAQNDTQLKAAWTLHLDSVITDVPAAALALYR